MIRPIKLSPEGSYVIAIPDEIMQQLGWKVGDNIVLDIPQVWPDQLTLHKVDRQETPNHDH